MAENSKIEWTDATWNPVRGCAKISPGCKHCYAKTFAERFRGVKGHPYEQGFDLRLVPEKLNEPLNWKKPKRIFVNSMSDLFHQDVPLDYIQRVFEVMNQAHWHTFQVLTKRAERMADLSDKLNWTSNIWAGASVEDQKYGLIRIDLLRIVPAAVRMLSCEPLLEDLGEVGLTGIDWVIVGGESGSGARPMEIGWLNSIRNQCIAAGVPVFIKQMGSEYAKRHHFGDSKGGDWNEWAAEYRIRQFPA